MFKTLKPKLCYWYWRVRLAWSKARTEAINFKLQVLREQIRIIHEQKAEAERLDRLRNPDKYRGQ